MFLQQANKRYTPIFFLAFLLMFQDFKTVIQGCKSRKQMKEWNLVIISYNNEVDLKTTIGTTWGTTSASSCYPRWEIRLASTTTMRFYNNITFKHNMLVCELIIIKLIIIK